jgi:hypothetical protein
MGTDIQYIKNIKKIKKALFTGGGRGKTKKTISIYLNYNLFHLALLQ